MTFQELQESLHVLGLKDRMTMQQIKDRHRELVKQYHPDRCEGADSEKIQLINNAYRIVSDYLDAYCYSFSEDEFYTQNPEENLRRQFMDDPVWGGVR